MKILKSISTLLIALLISISLFSQVELESYWGGGKSSAAALTETHAFISFGSFIYSVHLKTHQITGKFPLPSAISDIVIVGNTAFVAGYASGVYVVDISDPENMNTINHLTCVALKLQLFNNRLYVAGSSAGLYIYNISNTTQPLLLGSLDIEPVIYDVISNENHIYCACISKGLVVIDQTNPNELKELSTISTSKSIYRLMQHNNYLYASSDANAGIEIFDVSNPQLPVLKNSIPNDDPISEMKMMGNTMLVGSYHEGIRKFSLSDPENPTETARLDLGTVNRFVVNEKVICTVDDHEGAFIFPIVDNEIIEKTGHFELDFAPMKMFGVTDSVLYIPEQVSQYTEKLRIFNLSDPNHPIDHGYFDVNPEQIVSKGNVAFLLVDKKFSSDKIHVVDISDSNSPEEKSTLQLEADFGLLSIHENLIFTYAGGHDTKDGIEIIDVSDSLHPVSISFVEHSSILEQIGITDSALFVVDVNKQLHRINISNPKNPQIEEQPVFTDSIAGCWVKNNVGYFTDVEDSLRIFDLTDPFNPIHKNTLFTNRLRSQPKFYKDFAYTFGFMGMEIFNFSDPYYPSKDGFISIPGYFSSPTIIGNKLVVLKVIMEQKLSIFDLSIPSKPALTGEISPFGINTGIAVMGDTVFAANNLGGLHILNMTSDTTAELATHHVAGNLNAVDIQANYAYLAADNNGMQIIDVSTIKHPKMVGQFIEKNNGQERDVIVKDNLACLLGSGGVRLIDISVKENPQKIGALENDWSLLSGTLHNQVLYCCRGRSGIQVVNVGNPALPVIVGEYDSPGEALGIFVRNDTAFLADGRNSLRLLDVSNPQQISEISAYNLAPGYITDVVVVENYAFIAASFMGLYVLDIRNAQNILQLARFFVSGNDFQEVKVENANVYVSCKNTGVYKLSTSMLTIPIDTTIIDTTTIDTTSTFLMNLQTTASIDQNYPNPFNTNTIIHFQTKKQEEINLDIYDIYGKKVKTLVNETLPAGNYYTAWKGKNNRGKQLSPGTYFLRFKVGNFISVKKMILIE